ncbi:MAG TPA: DMT family transporter [Candidatus Sulfotelmatobacter sp.]|nr:DMT family transporter [Candidatus Sulfotelmatobacter sp.]
MRIDPSHGRAPSRAAVTLSIALVIAIWALNFLIVKIGVRYLPALAFASFRIVAAGLFMILIAPFCARLPIFRERSSSLAHSPTKTSPVVSPLATRHSLGLSKPEGPLLHDYWVFAYLGFFGVCINQFCFTLGLRYTSVTHSSIIVGLAPIYTLALAVLFRLEQLSWRKASGMTIAFAGVAILASGTGMGHHSPTLLGDAITMCGSIGFATYVVLGKRVAGQYNPLTMTLWNFIFGALFILPIAIQQAHAFGFPRNFRNVPWQGWLCLVYTALFSSTLAYIFYFWLLRYLEASQLASFSYLLPVSASALGIVFLGERGSWLELLGGLLALLGLYWIESARR